MAATAFGRLLPPPLSVRRSIPFYHAKTEAEFRDDVYERYDELVTRQTALHLADELHAGYPFQPVVDYVLRWLPQAKAGAVADLGCSVGRLAAEVARTQDAMDVYGVDLSYQMLRQARDFWVQGETLRPRLDRYGWGNPTLTGHRIPNLHFALAKGERLPFPDHCLDAVISTFLLDRFPRPFSAFAEWRRVLRPQGRIICVSPLNFLQPAAWREAHPPVKILAQLQNNGWAIEDWRDPLELREPMDARGNAVCWRTIACVASPAAASG